MRALDAVRGPDAAAVRVQDALPVLAAVPAQGETVVRELDVLRVQDAVAVLEQDVFRVQGVAQGPMRAWVWSRALAVALGLVLLQVRDAAAAVRKLAALLA